MKLSIILTSYDEYRTITKAISQIAKTNTKDFELIVVSPDKKTQIAAKSEILKHRNLKHYKVVEDSGTGKPNAINTAMNVAKGGIIILTDGDMYISDDAIDILISDLKDNLTGGVSGHPVSLDNRATFWGFSSHLFCHGAHIMRTLSQQKKQIPMSGYLYAIKMTDNISKIFPLPADVRAEDAYISKQISDLGYKISYSSNAIAYVKFPKNLHDWLKQKKRSLGGNVQIKNQRSIFEDLQNVIITIKFAKSPKEYLYLIGIYLLRLYLWIIIYVQDFKKSYSNGRWEKITSSKE